MFNSILCAVDFSETSEQALRYARDLAAVTKGHLTVVHVVDQLLHTAAHTSGSGEAYMKQTQEELDKLLRRIAPERPFGITVEVGDAAEQILKQVDECRADLIVMGTHGREGAQRLVFGSTAEAVLRRSAVPVLAVPAPPGAE